MVYVFFFIFLIFKKMGFVASRLLPLTTKRVQIGTLFSEREESFL